VVVVVVEVVVVGVVVVVVGVVVVVVVGVVVDVVDVVVVVVLGSIIYKVFKFGDLIYSCSFSDSNISIIGSGDKNTTSS
jgi:hypothetical protein